LFADFPLFSSQLSGDNSNQERGEPEMSIRNFEQFTISIESSDLKAIKHIAIDEDVPATTIIRDAVEEFLAKRKLLKNEGQRDQ